MRPALIAGLLFLQACATFPGGVVRVEEQDSARNLEVKTGQLLEIRLAHPGRGLTITLGTVVAPALALVGNPTHHDDTIRGGVSGTGSYEAWLFRAVQPGVANVQLDYRQPWDTMGKPTRSVTWTVTVQ